MERKVKSKEDILNAIELFTAAISNSSSSTNNNDKGHDPISPASEKEENRIQSSKDDTRAEPKQPPRPSQRMKSLPGKEEAGLACHT